MGFFGYFSCSTTHNVDSSTGDRRMSLEAAIPTMITPELGTSSTIHDNESSIHAKAPLSGQKTSNVVIPTFKAGYKRLRVSFRPFGLSSKEGERKPALLAIQEQEKRRHAAESSSKRFQKVQVFNSEKRAKKSALQLRAIVIGPTSTVALTVTPVVAKPQLSKLKSQLMQPKTANKLIAQLRTLPASGQPSIDHTSRPIHAVCLAYTEFEEDHLHFAKLCTVDGQVSAQGVDVPGVISAPLDTLADMFKEMHVIDLVTSPDFGLGQPGNGKGILAGAVPTAETVLQGVEKITPELMALGYATGKIISTDHSGIYPPIDRISVLTYWWGLEVVLPPPSLEYLSNVRSVTGTVINFLSAISLVNNGVREILPFIRYIAQFIDFEFDTIKKQDKGAGVVCAATWIMPAALVPRPWDFPVPGPVSSTRDAETSAGSSTLLNGFDRSQNTADISSPFDTVTTSHVKKPPALQTPVQTRVGILVKG